MTPPKATDGGSFSKCCGVTNWRDYGIDSVAEFVGHDSPQEQELKSKAHIGQQDEDEPQMRPRERL